MILSTVGVFFCSAWWQLPWTVDLHALGRHNRIEHDCSMTHDDAKPGAAFAPSHPDCKLLCHLLAQGGDKEYLDMGDFVHARIQRAVKDRKPLDAVHKEIAHGEVALTLLVLGKKRSDDSRVVSRQFIRQWFWEAKLPEGWKKPAKEVSVWQAVSLSQGFKAKIAVEDWVQRAA